MRLVELIFVKVFFFFQVSLEFLKKKPKINYLSKFNCYHCFFSQERGSHDLWLYGIVLLLPSCVEFIMKRKKTALAATCNNYVMTCDSRTFSMFKWWLDNPCAGYLYLSFRGSLGLFLFYKMFLLSFVLIG